MQECNLEEQSKEDHLPYCNEDRDGWNEDLINAISLKVGKLEKDPEKTRLSRIRLCLDEGADINVQDKNGDTVLHVAVKRSYRKIVELCLEKKAKTDIPNHNGETVMKLAETLKNEDILRILKKPILERREPQACAPSGANDSIPIADDPKASTSRDGNVGLHRKHVDIEDDSARIDSKKRADFVRDETKADKMPDLEKNPHYRQGATLTKSWPGIVYQLRHLTFTLHCALQQEDPYFFLATEMIDAEKLDDVVLLYVNSSGTKVGRFVQIKYTTNESRRISAQQLLEPDGNYSLLTYFISWCKVKENTLFRNVEVRNMILCTNTGLDPEELEKIGIYCEEAEEPDKSFELKSRVKKSACYKLSVDSELNAKLYHELKSTSALRRLANWTAKCIYEKKSMRLNMGNFRDYHLALARDVFNTKTKQFHDKFVEDKDLPGNVKKFRELFLIEFLNMARPEEKKIFEKSPWKEVNERFQTLTFQQDFGNAPKSQTNSSTQNCKLPDDCVEDEEISQFLEEFTLAVNQPNGDELDEIIRDKIDANSRFNLMNTQLLDGTVRTKIFDWFVKKNAQGRTDYFSYKVGEELFKDMNDTIGSLITVGVKSTYCARLKAYDIRFEQEMQRVTAFLTGDGSNSASERILELVAPKKTLLTALRVYDTLEKIPKYRKMDSFIFIDMESLKLPGIQNIVMPSFASQHYPDLLIVDCGSNRAEKYLQKLWNPLCKIMGQNTHKRMIIITQAGGDSGARMDLGHEVCYEESNEYTFCKLTDHSQKRLLARPVTAFQGHECNTSFGELLGIDHHCDNIGADALATSLEIMDSDVLDELIRSDEIKIGSVLEGLGEVCHYYIHRKIHQQIVIRKEIFKDQQMPDLLAISGTDGKRPGTLEEEQKSPGNRDVTNFIVLNNPEHEEQFRALCAKNMHRNIHWLNEESGKYEWKRSQRSIANLIRYRDVTTNDDNTDLSGATYLSETQLSAYNEPVIISDTAGMGKSTMLTQLAWRIKKDHPNMLVLRIDLVQHVVSLAEVKDKKTCNLRNFDEAVRFLVNKLVSHKTNLERKVLGTILEKRRKVALIVDGFDEISPTHEGVVIDLIRGLSSGGMKKLFIATRPHTRGALEKELNAFSYEITPFSVENQVAFLTQFWKNKLDLGSDSKQRTEGRIHKYAKAIMQKLAKSIKDQSNIFTGLPLQARMVAEIFGDHHDGQRKDFDSCEEYVESEVDEPEFPEEINLIHLYDRFVEKMFNISFNKSGRNTADEMAKECKILRFNHFINTHKKLALDSLFDEKQVQKLLVSQRETPQTYFEIVEERTGIITQFIDGRPQFGHRTYAEYFAAKFISEMLGKGDLHKSTMEIIVSDILLQRNYQNERAFLNWLLSEKQNHTLENREQWRFYLNKCRNEGQETILHAAAAEGNNCIIRMFLYCVDANSEHRTDLIEVKDDSGWTAVHRAVQNGHLDGIKLLLEHTYFNIDSQNGMGETSLYLAVSTRELNVAKYLLEKGANVNLQDNDGWTPLHSASYKGQLEVVKFLLDKGADVNLGNDAGWTPLHSASYKGQLEVVKFLLDKGADVNLGNNAGRTPLDSAAFQGQLEVVKFLLDKGADVNFGDNAGWTPLHSASYGGQLEVVKFLVDKGADVNFGDNAGRTLLDSAASQGQLEVVKFLLDKGADVNLGDNAGWTPLHSASYGGQLEVVKFLLDKGADVNFGNNAGRTPLDSAAFQGQLEVVKFLLDKGADVNLGDNAGWTPLHSASYGGQLEVVKFLLDKGADVNFGDNAGRTLLDSAAFQGQLEVVKFLLDKGADVNLGDDAGWTPLNSASHKGQLEVVKFLLDKGADVNLGSNAGWTPLNSASREGQLEVVKFLLDKGADVNLGNNAGRTPLDSAAFQGQLEVVKILLDKGADVNLGDDAGWTPLNSASHKGQLEVVKFLLDKGADVNLGNNAGRTPLDSAAFQGQLEVVKFLLDKGADVNLGNNAGRTPLDSAAFQGQLEVVKFLLDKGADVNLGDNAGWTPLHSASCEGQLEVVKFLLDKGADVNPGNNAGRTPLDSAAFQGQLEVVKFLLDKGADVNRGDDAGWTPLYSASREGQLEVVKFLLDKGADVNLGNNAGRTPLDSAAFQGQLEVVKFLLDKGADVNFGDDAGWTPLYSASCEGQLEVVKFLLDKGADVNLGNNAGWTPLESAAFQGQLEVVKFLLDKGADVNLGNNAGWTPLYSASREGQLDVVKFLLDKGADVNLGNNAGWTPLDSAAFRGQLEVVKFLLDKGADVNLGNNAGWTPLDSASREGQLEVVKFLLDKGADVNLRDNDGWTPLHSAAFEGHLEVVEFFLDKEIDMNFRNNDGFTPLHSAAGKGQLDVVKFLLSKGADVVVQSNDGWTPLHSAACKGQLAVVKFLLETGADFNLQDNNGRTPLHSAACESQLEIVKFLLDMGADVNFQSHDGSTLFHLAAREGQLEIVKFFLATGGDVNLRSIDGWTLLHSAVREGQLEIVQFLLDMGADVHSQSHDGSTPLHLAAGGGQLVIVRYLLVRGADITSQDNSGRMPLQSAEASNRFHVAEYLRTAGGNVSF